MMSDQLLTFFEGIGAFVALYGLSVPARKAWQARRHRRQEYRLDHEGRPARVDPGTGQPIPGTEQPGLAAALTDIRNRQVTVIATQQQTAATVDQIHQHLTDTADNTEAIHEIRDGMKTLADTLERQAMKADQRHAENRAVNAETQAHVARLEITLQGVAQQATDAAIQARDAAGHSARLDRQQKEMAAQVEAEFEKQRAWTGAYVTALGDMGVNITPPE